MSSESFNTIFLDGRNLYLRPLERNDLKGHYYRWLNDPQVNSYNSHGRFPYNEIKMEEYFNYASTTNEALILAMIDKQTKIHIGNISLQRIQWVDRNAEFAIVLGEKDFWGKGYAVEAGKLLIEHGFKSLNLHRIYCGTSSANLGMQKLAQKLKMIKEGVKKEALFKNGLYFDIYEYAILNSII